MPAEPRYRAAAKGDLVRVELDALGKGEWTLAGFAEHLAVNFDLSSAPAEDGAVAASAALDTKISGLPRSTDGVETMVAHHLGELMALGLVEAR